VGNLILVLRCHFRSGHTHGGIVENGVIAEAVLAHRGTEQLAVDLAPGLDYLTLGVTMVMTQTNWAWR